MDEPWAIDERFKLLMSHQIFRACDRATLDRLAHEGSWIRYGLNQSLFLQGDECNSLLIIAAGRVALSFVSEQGREVIVSEAGPGEILGDVELVLGRRRLTNGSAAEPIRLLSLKRTSFIRMLGDQAFSRAMLETVCARWCRLAHFTEVISLRTLEQRLASLILGLCRSHGRSVGDGVLIERAMSQTRMAQLINASRPKVNVQLHAWQTRGLISLERNRITVRHGSALERIAVP